MPNELPGQLSIFGENDDSNYQAFVDKFKPKKTTDDCYTPQIVYDAVADWVAGEYHIDRLNFVRPFQPGGDYENFCYGSESVVVDNPPFSILSQILRFYRSRSIRFFLFSPHLTVFKPFDDLCYIPCNVSITYDNGAIVNTGFVTNLDTALIRSIPELYEAVDRANRENASRYTVHYPTYSYPGNVITAAMVGILSKYGVPLRINRHSAKFIRALDHQRAQGKAIFGAGYLLSDAAAAKAAAAKMDNSIIWEISDRERRIIESMEKEGENHGEP